jgi:hypothetical protein
MIVTEEPGSHEWRTVEVPDLGSNIYYVRRFRVERDVVFPWRYSTPPKVWVRGRQTTGYGLDHPNYFGPGRGEVVPGSVTTQGCRLRTYVFKVFDQHGGLMPNEFYPSRPENVVISYGVLGVPEPVSASIGGPSNSASGAMATWPTTVSGGTGNYSYEWRWRYTVSGDWTAPVGSSASLTMATPCKDFTLWCRVSSGGMVADAYKYVFVPYACGGDGGGGCEGCPFLDVYSNGEWIVENSILGRNLDRQTIDDVYRLKAPLTPVDGTYRLRIRENEREITTLAATWLVAVDHDPATDARALRHQIVLVKRLPPVRAVTGSGTNVTELVDGVGTDYFMGRAGETLIVDLTPPGPSSTTKAVSAEDLDPFEMDDDGKDGRVCLRTGGSQLERVAEDAAILATTGIVVQGKDELGQWREVRKHYPRRFFDASLVDTLEDGPVRLVFIGDHRLRYVGKVLPVAVASPQPLSLLSARHSREGDVRAAVSSPQAPNCFLVPGDTLSLSFAALRPPAEGQVRDYFLISSGRYTTLVEYQDVEPGPKSTPLDFSLRPMRPNPFSHSTSISFDLPRAAPVRLQVFDLQGRLVRTLLDRTLPAGTWSAEWDARDDSGSLLPAAIYFCRMESGAYRTGSKLVLAP